MKVLSASMAVASGLVLFLHIGCQSGGVPQTGSQTNWLRACDATSPCGDLVCVCGTCTLSCDDALDCGGLGSDSCVVATDAGVTAACDGQIATTGMCLPKCDDEPCPDGAACVAGVCVAPREASAQLTIDPSVRHQTLIGFGASLGLDEDFIVGHPEKEAIYDAMFSGTGFNFVRLRNRFRGDNADDLAAASEILRAAEERMGELPTLFFMSGSPPPTLKANGASFCANADPDCTLARNQDGDFDYAAYAEYWRSSLEAYAALGIVPDFVSMQNNPDWIPPDEGSVEACRFLPQEGTATVETADGPVEAQFPGYLEALTAVRAAVDTLPDDYVFAGPETSQVATFEQYEDALAEVQSLSYHLYESDVSDVPIEELRAIRDLGQERDQPIIQSEMRAPAIDTAVLAHHALVDGGSSAYLQLGFVVPTDDEEFGTLIAADDTTFRKHPTYFALSHFARFTQKGWVRVEAEADSARVLASAWLSPDENSLTVVLINNQAEPINVQVPLPDDLPQPLENTTVIRTVFDGLEELVDLGNLPEGGVVRLPPNSIVTVTASAE